MCALSSQACLRPGQRLVAQLAGLVRRPCLCLFLLQDLQLGASCCALQGCGRAAWAGPVRRALHRRQATRASRPPWHAWPCQAAKAVMPDPAPGASNKGASMLLAPPERHTRWVQCLKARTACNTAVRTRLPAVASAGPAAHCDRQAAPRKAPACSGNVGAGLHALMAASPEAEAKVPAAEYINDVGEFLQGEPGGPLVLSPL